MTHKMTEKLPVGMHDQLYQETDTVCHFFWHAYLAFEELHMLKRGLANLKALQRCFAGFFKHHFAGRQGLCSHLAHLWATSNSAPRSEAVGTPKAAGVM